MKTFVLVGLVGILAGRAGAVTFGFGNISPSGFSGNTADQISVDVVAGVGSSVRFNFSFAAGDPGTVTYFGFDDGTGSAPSLLSGLATIFNGSGVSFVNGSGPQISPLAPTFVEDFGAVRASQGGAGNGFSIGETLGLQYALQSGKTVADVLNAIDSGSLRIGLHIQQLTQGSQKAVVTPHPPANVPDGGSTLALIGLGIAGLGLARRKLS